MDEQATNNISAEQKSGSTGGIIGAIIIIILIVIGGFYFIGNRVEKIQEQKQNTPVNEITTGTSTELVDIQTDLDNVNLDVLNQ